MTEFEALERMIAPGTRRPGKYREGVIQVWVTRACDKACFGCTQGSNLTGKPGLMTPDQFGQALESLKGYFGVVGMFGGNPAMHPHFEELCRVLRASWVPKEQRGIWSNNPITRQNASVMRDTFNPAVSNLNVHLDQQAYDLFQQGWPECHPVGLHQDSRHAPPFVAMKDVLADEGRRWELISNCPINLHWSAMIGVFRGGLRAWFCEVAGAQSMLHQEESDYPDTGIPIDLGDGHIYDFWWRHPMAFYAQQVRNHCHECGVPLQGYGELAQATDPAAAEQVSATHQAVYRPKRAGRRVELVMAQEQLQQGRVSNMTKYLQNANL